MEQIYSNIRKLSEEIVRECLKYGIKIASAESCTGGMISGEITAISGSSSVIEFGICSYSNRIKREILGVSDKTLDTFSEYSTECAEEMANGALRLSGADYAVSTSGVAGPSGGSVKNPVGTVYIAVCGKNSAWSQRYEFPNKGRDQIRTAAVNTALEMLLKTIKDKEET